MWERWREGLAQGLDPDVAHKGGGECSVLVCGVLGLPLGAFCVFTARPCSLRGWAGWGGAGVGRGVVGGGVCVHTPSTGGDLPKGPSG